jgi:hypothetical protein
MATLSGRLSGVAVRFVPLLLGLTVPGRSASGQDPALEYRVKAAYLLNFTRYTEWPPTAFAGPSDALNVCIVGRDPFGPVLDQTLLARRRSSRPVHILRPARPTEGLCHVAFLGAATPAVLESWLAALATEPTLTVGDGDSFVDAGGMIGFVIVDETVRFEINAAAARAARLQLSSRLLALATRLVPEQTP